MIRRLFTIASALSLLLTMIVAVIWVRSYWRFDYLMLEGSTPGYDTCTVAGIANGRCFLVRDLSEQATPRAVPRRFHWTHPSLNAMECYYRQVRHTSTANVWGVESLSVTWGRPYDDTVRHGIIFRAWALFAMTLALSSIWILKATISIARRRHGCCSACRYDLRASKDRCPECGTPIPENATATCL